MASIDKLKIPGSVLRAAALFWLILTLLILHRHYSFYPSFTSHDQGILNQVFWNSSHGNWFQGTLSSGASSAVWIDGQVPDVSYRRLGQHFTPAHFFWLPLYALLPGPATLLVLQITLVTAAGLVLYRLAQTLVQPQTATWICFSYYCATAVIGPSLANFHDLSQVPLFTFVLLLGLEKRHWPLMTGGMVCLLMSREDAGIVLFSLGAYLVLSRRYPRIGAGFCLLGVTHLLVITNWVMPLFSDEVAQHFMSGVYGQYVAEGDHPSTWAVMVGLLRQPGLLLRDVFTPVSETLRYVLGHWLPLMFVPAISLAAWVSSGFPLLALLLRQDTSMALSMQMRYALTVVPGLFYGAIVWWAAHPGTFTLRTRRFWATCLGLSLFFTFTLNPIRTWSFILPDSIDPWVYVSPGQQWHHAAQVRSLLQQIPPDASVGATDHLLPHVSSRRAVTRFPNLLFRNDQDQVKAVDYVIADLWQLAQYQAAFRGDRENLQTWVPIVDQWLETKTYQLIDYEPGVVLLAREGRSDPDALAGWIKFSQQIPTH